MYFVIVPLIRTGFIVPAFPTTTLTPRERREQAERENDNPAWER